MKKNKEHILHKYLNGEATVEEINMLKSDEDFTAYLKISEVSKSLQTPSFKSEDNLRAIKSKIAQKDTKVKPLFSRKQFFRIAAVIALLVTSYLFLNNSDTSITTAIAQKENFLLPDTSEVSLNAMSTITYNKKQWSNERNLTLEGEAYFKVKKGATFSVETPQGTVTVLGTQFNVFSRGKQFNITCYEGLVSVTFNDTLIKVPAGNFITIEDNRLINNQLLTLMAPSWVQNESTFEDASLTNVLLELERQYPVKINTKINTDKRFTGSFTHTNLTVALRSICDPLQLDFTIANDEVTLYAKNSN